MRYEIVMIYTVSHGQRGLDLLLLCDDKEGKIEDKG